MNNILSALFITLGIQAVFFLFAASFQTDKVTDLSYGLTFVILAIMFANASLFSIILAGMIVLWGARLAGYLFFRILKMKKDDRFDGIRENFWRFAKFWTLQGIAIWVIMLPALIAMTGETAQPPTVSIIGLLVFLAGLIIETIADWQKYRFKAQGKSGFIQTGLWKHARHPNYFGELLVWWGVFLYTLPVLQGWEYLSVVGPIAITVLLLFVTGVPTLEKKMRKKKGYAAYKKQTRLLVPLPKF